ncbi:MAG TPA: PaaI family thioesterase [Acidimicrobiales bacterium]|nr:PaaI family thioesterase [Acidimicrobiales bacterium]
MSDSWQQMMRAALDADVDPRRAELHRLGDEMRRLIELLTGTGASVDQLKQAADAVGEVVGRFEGYPRGRVYDAFGESANAGNPSALFDFSPIMGAANPLAPPVILEPADGKVRGRATFGSAYEGPPGCVHGGWLAATFDEVLGMAQSMGGNPGMTGTLTVRYRRPTPLHTPLTFEGELVRVEARKIFTAGRCLLDGEMTAEAEAIFISVDFSRIAALFDARQAGGGDSASG